MEQKRQAHSRAKKLEIYRATHVHRSAIDQIDPVRGHVIAVTSQFRQGKKDIRDGSNIVSSKREIEPKEVKFLSL
jgi:hypothetical protein